VVTRLTPSAVTVDPPSGRVPDVGRAATGTLLRTTPNALITSLVESMPTQTGCYRANIAAMNSLRSSILVTNSRLVIDPSRTTPSFCSGATYLVFLMALDRMHRDGTIQLDDATLRALLVQDHQADGAGVWGRWNANGPGTARLFYEAGLGTNFTSLAEARSGDFMKVFWNDEIGSREAGHSVVYLDTVTRPEGEFIRYWSSNQPDGFGIKEVPRQRIRRILFSRLEHPDQIRQITALPSRDPYLAAMLKRPSTGEEMQKMVGIAQTTTPTGPVAAIDNRAPSSTKSSSTTATPTAAPSTPAPANPPVRTESWLKRLFHPQKD
jgi:hypothetical protein